MARPSHQAAAAAAAGAGLLLLCGCGSSAAPAAAGSSTPATGSSPARLASSFCGDASNFMRNIPEEPKSKRLTPTQAEANMDAVLVSTVQGFARLEREAPAKLRKPLRKIIAVYKADEKLLKKTGDMARVSQSMVQSDGAGSASFQQVLKYISVTCR
jgi:hypothetical protein